MADTAKRMVGPYALTTTPGTNPGYTAPAAGVVIRSIRVANTTTASVDVRVSIGADSQTTRIVPDVAVPAKSTASFSDFIPMVSGEVFNASASAVGCNLTISGVEL